MADRAPTVIEYDEEIVDESPVLSEVPGGVTFTEPAQPAAVNGTLPRTRSPVVIEEGELVSVEPDPVVPAKSFAEGFLETFAFIPDLPLNIINKVFMEHPPTQEVTPPGINIKEEDAPIPTPGRYRAGLTELPEAKKWITGGDILKRGAKELTFGVVDPYPREPRTDQEKLIQEASYFAGMAATFPIPLGLYAKWANAVNMRTPQGVAARRVLQKYYSAPEAFADSLLDYGRKYVTRPTPLREMGMGLTMGAAHAFPHFMDNPNEEMPLNLGELGTVDIKPTVQLLLSMGLPILVAARTPTTWAEGLGPASKQFLGRMYGDTLDFGKRMFSGWVPHGREDMAARAWKKMATELEFPPMDPAQRTGETTAELFVKAMEEGLFAGTTSGTTPLKLGPNGELLPATAGLNPDTMQIFREMGINDIGLMALERQLIKQPRIAMARMEREEEIKATINRVIEGFELRLGNTNPDEAYNFLETARTQLRENSEEQVQLAAREALDAYKNLHPVLGRENASVVAREMVDNALDAAKKTEGELWSPEVLGASDVHNTRMIGDWALEQIKNASRSKRQKLPSEYYMLAGTTRLESIGIGTSGKPLTKRDIPASVQDENGNLLVENLESIPKNGLYDLYPTGGIPAEVSLTERAVSIKDIQEYRSDLGDSMSIAYRAKRNKLGSFYADIRKFLTDEVLVEGNIFAGAAGETAEMAALWSQFRETQGLLNTQRTVLRELTETGGAQSSIDAVKQRIAQGEAVQNQFQQEIDALRGVAQESAEIPLAQQLEALKEARFYTKWIHDTYERTKLGELLGLKASGAERTSPEEFLSKLVKTGAGSGARVAEFRNAINVPQKMVDAGGAVTYGTPIEATLRPGGNPDVIEAEILRRLVESTRGKVTEAKVQFLIQQHKEAINQVPGLMKRLTNLEGLQRDATDIATRTTTPTNSQISAALEREGTLADVEQARIVNLRRLESQQENNSAFIYLGADKQVAAEAFLDLPLKQAFTRAEAINRELVRDKSGAALDGFRVGLWRALRKRSTPTDPDTGLSSGDVDLKMLSQNIETYRPYVDQFFDEAQIAWLENMVAGGKYARLGYEPKHIQAAQEDLMAIGQGKAVQETVHAGGRVAGQQIGENLIALNTLSSSFLGRRIAADIWATKGRGEIQDYLESAFRSGEAATLLTKRAMDLPAVSPPLLKRAISESLRKAVGYHQQAMDKLKVQRQAAREQYLDAYDTAIARGASEEAAKTIGGEASADANRAAREEVEASLKKMRDDGVKEGLNFASAGFGKTLGFIGSRLMPRLERLAALGLIEATYPLKPRTIEADWQLGAPFTFEENRRRLKIERQRVLNKTAEQTSLVAPQSIARPVADSSLSPVAAPVRPSVQPPVPAAAPGAAPDPSIQERGEALFPNDPIFAPGLMNKGGIASVKKKPKQMVY